MGTKKRQLSKKEKEEVIELQKGADGVLRCFISGRIIDLDNDKVEFDHLKPYASGGSTIIANERVFLKEYNREKGKMSLPDYKDYYDLKRFYETKGNKVKLQDIYKHLGLTIENTAGKIENDKIEIEGGTKKEKFNLLSDPKLEIDYCYANVPINWILNDDEEGLQPRVIDFKRLWMLKQHLSDYPQLAPSIARFLNNKIRLFDGQHKLAAQLLMV